MATVTELVEGKAHLHTLKGSRLPWQQRLQEESHLLVNEVRSQK